MYTKEDDSGEDDESDSNNTLSEKMNSHSATHLTSSSFPLAHGSNIAPCNATTNNPSPSPLRMAIKSLSCASAQSSNCSLIRTLPWFHAKVGSALMVLRQTSGRHEVSKKLICPQILLVLGAIGHFSSLSGTNNGLFAH